MGGGVWEGEKRDCREKEKLTYSAYLNFRKLKKVTEKKDLSKELAKSYKKRMGYRDKILAQRDTKWTLCKYNDTPASKLWP